MTLAKAKLLQIAQLKLVVREDALIALLAVIHIALVVAEHVKELAQVVL